MSFRYGPIVRCLVYNLDDDSKKYIELKKPTFFDLIIALQIENTATNIFVKRRNKLFAIQTNRDVEEIGAATGEEVMYLSSKDTLDALDALDALDLLDIAILPLSRYQFHRSDIPVKIDVYGDCIISSNRANIMEKGGIIFEGIRTHGFLRVRLDKTECITLKKIFEEIKWFTEQNRAIKDRYSYQSIGSDSTQPQFGYRQTDLSKQYFVCRKLSDKLKTEFDIKYPSETFETCVAEYMDMMGDITKHILSALLFEIGYDRYHVRNILEGSLSPAQSLSTLGFTSMTELFRYDCSGYVDDENNLRMPCGDHQDVSLFTIIPAAQGTGGLEIFDWKREWLRVEEHMQIFPNECIVFPGELLQRLTAGIINATPHRVVVKVGPECKDRISCPFELLLRPDYIIDCNTLLFNTQTQITTDYRKTETAQDYISRISQNLVSVNK